MCDKLKSVLIAMVVSSVLSSQAYSEGLLAHWRFQEGCRDLSGNNVDIQLGGFKIAEEPRSKTPCAFNDGSQSKGVWMTVPNHPVFKDLDALTIVFTIKCLPSNPNGWLLYKTAPSGCDFGVVLSNLPVKGKEAFYRIGLKINTTTKWLWVNRSQHPPTEWNRFAITLDLKGDRVPRLYINKVLVAQSDSFGLDDVYTDENGDRIGTVDFYEFNDGIIPCSGKPLFIGGANAHRKNSFQGYIEELLLFNKALSATELQSL